MSQKIDCTTDPWIHKIQTGLPETLCSSRGDVCLRLRSRILRYAVMMGFRCHPHFAVTVCDQCWNGVRPLPWTQLTLQTPLYIYILSFFDYSPYLPVGDSALHQRGCVRAVRQTDSSMGGRGAAAHERLTGSVLRHEWGEYTREPVDLQLPAPSHPPPTPLSLVL